MKKSDFLEHKTEYIETCEAIIKHEGMCLQFLTSISCGYCPFDATNAENNDNCTANGYCDSYSKRNVKDETLLKSASNYLKLFRDKQEIEKDHRSPDRYIIVVE